jgi:uncharacterized protein (DUF1015 family)
MALFFPFAAYRPKPDVAKHLSCPPYDVITVEEAHAFIADKPHNLLPALLPEIAQDAQGDNLAALSARYLHQLIHDESLICHDKEPFFYVYQQSYKGTIRTGFFGCVSTDDYESGRIKRHELTRPDKVKERTDYMISQHAHAEPVMLAYKNTPRLTALMKASLIDAIPLLDFTDEQGGRHRLSQLHPEIIPDIQQAFTGIDLYIADGHHRCQAASECAHRMGASNTAGQDEPTHFPAVLLPDDELVILPYHRYLRNLDDLHFDTLAQVLELVPCEPSLPTQEGTVVIGTHKGWFQGTLHSPSKAGNSTSTVDAQVLYERVLQPLYQIHDIRTDQRIGFIGGSGSLDTLITLLEQATIDIAFLMYPVSISTLMEVSDRGAIMPPKSTWFEPKLRSGLLIHTF